MKKFFDKQHLLNNKLLIVVSWLIFSIGFTLAIHNDFILFLPRVALIVFATVLTCMIVDPRKYFNILTIFTTVPFMYTLFMLLANIGFKPILI